MKYIIKDSNFNIYNNINLDILLQKLFYFIF
uniref:Uncharacterized protein n=1 Tax=viral metagenome TaxID=1070528 RepID=A0A6C0BEC6_9ZZZZ